ncbi:MAG: TspO/MBR family protein [Verrucomicrobiaceae bacterium]
MASSLVVKSVVCVILMQLLGGLGAFLTTSSIDTWYADLISPPGTPPNWVFGPVWTTLYAMIGVSFALLWHRHPAQLGRTRPTFLFFTQLLLNLVWTPAFFGAHLIEVALVIIVLLWIFIILTIREFKRFSKPAALLLVPYLLWVSYATYLNAGYAILN